MKIISGFKHPHKEEWNKALANLKESGERLGHDVFIASLPTQDFWLTKYDELFISLCWKYKILFMLEQLRTTKEDLVWIDGDCVIAKKIDFTEAMGECDIGLTLRDIKDRHNTNEPQRDGYLNSGVIFIRNNEASRIFLERTRKSFLLCSLYDQEALNKYILEYHNMSNHGQEFTIDTTRIRLLNCREYNNFYFDESFLKAKIQHFKSQVGREKYKELYGVEL